MNTILLVLLALLVVAIIRLLTLGSEEDIDKSREYGVSEELENKIDFTIKIAAFITAIILILSYARVFYESF